VAKKKVKPPASETPVKTESDYEDFVKYLTVRNADDPRVDQLIVECFIQSMNGEHVNDLRDIFEIYLKLDRHAGEFWDMKNKRTAN
jgi:hypothetical protein